MDLTANPKGVMLSPPIWLDGSMTCTPAPRTSAVSWFTDVLMSGLAVFGLKFPSLLQYDQNRPTLDHNLLSFYHTGSLLRWKIENETFKVLFEFVQRSSLEVFIPFHDGQKQPQYFLTTETMPRSVRLRVLVVQKIFEAHKIPLQWMIG